MNNTKEVNMDNTKNALAELAECIKNADIQIGKMAGCSFECIRKAQRIVAELAKLQFDANGKPNMYDTYHCAVNCRAIAEEGGVK